MRKIERSERRERGDKERCSSTRERGGREVDRIKRGRKEGELERKSE